MIVAAWTLQDWAAVLAPTVVLFIGVVTLLVNGERAERQRRRELHARALAAAMAYAEMPFEIRRRRHEEGERSAERVRLTTRFSDVRAELAVCQALIDAEGNADVTTAYGELINATRRVAGGAARDAWNAEPIKRDADVNMAALAEQLQPLAAIRNRYTDEIRRAARSPWRKFRDAIETPADSA